jgi:hypothetical protein
MNDQVFCSSLTVLPYSVFCQLGASYVCHRICFSIFLEIYFYSIFYLFHFPFPLFMLCHFQVDRSPRLSKSICRHQKKILVTCVQVHDLSTMVLYGKAFMIIAMTLTLSPSSPLNYAYIVLSTSNMVD